MLRERIQQVDEWKNLSYVDVATLEDVDRQFLVERQLISREHSEAEGARSVAIDPHEKFSLMVNEEDHLRIQVMQSGLDLQAAWAQIDHIDDLIEQRVTYAFNERWGYLTACPTNVGTGHAGERDAAPAGAGDHPRRSRRSSAACTRSAWPCAGSMAKAPRPWATSTRSATRSRWAAANSN